MENCDYLNVMRHSLAHVLAHALKGIFCEIKLGIGPVIENGFYYDVLSEHAITESDFANIEKSMRLIINDDLVIEKQVWERDEAIAYFSNLGEDFKVEIIKDIADPIITVYKQGNFVDLCRGPHLSSTGCIAPYFKLMKISGAYWRGDSKNQMLTRIYGVLFSSQKELDDHLNYLEEVEKRDHRKLGAQMDLFHIQQEAVGSVFWHADGWSIYRTLKNYIRREIYKDGYVEVCTPQLVDRSLWEASGHWEKFHENMFISHDEDKVLAIKPMNCPGGIQIFNQTLKSYKQLPLRMAEFGVCHRNESSGSLYGTMRVRCFTCDDGHIFCTQEQINSETQAFCKLLKKIYKDLGFDSFKVKFSTRPDVRAGSDEIWDLAESLLQKAADQVGLECELNEGEGAFYGPKLEFVLRDKLGRDWQCGTLQVDFVLPERLNCWYVGEDGEKHHPIMLHRAVLGSLERFIGILLEHYAGKLPIWLAPVQVVVANITNDSDGFASEIFEKLVDAGIRAKLDVRAEKISYKIREHTTKKVPVMFIIGKNELENKTVTVRKLSGDQETLFLQDALDKMKIMSKLPL